VRIFIMRQLEIELIELDYRPPMRAASEPPSANLQHPSPKIGFSSGKCCDSEDGVACSVFQ
jgi:hypothetical protein